MIEVYYLSNTSSGRTAMKWLEDHNLQFFERKITKKSPLEIHEIKKMLEHTENGFDDLINTRTKRFKELEINENECSTDYLFELLIKNPLLIKLPIIIDDKKLVVGFNEREIRCFLSKEYRRTLLLNSGGYLVEEEL
ncbi:Spx/MgsR family RNA polymerase-binding regulatory protein [Enterococcus sp. AZ015]|uniref:Spx/MgsR family RNA polymerase-binding regulatory protein n=1 Tax=Enterococcus sp. AZ015 TaxID=2774888 RepID=UPI003D28275F